MQTRQLSPDPPWRRVKLSLERPYKDDNGNPILTLLDITADVPPQFIYEPQEEWDAKLGKRFRQIFAERGIDFFDRSTDPSKEPRPDPAQSNPSTSGSDPCAHTDSQPGKDGDGNAESKLMTPDMLFKMRSEILPRLHVALGEMSHARDLLSLLLSTSLPASSGTDVSALLTTPSLNFHSATPNPNLTPGLLTASSVSQLPPIPSVQAFNAQLVLGGKDDALRQASSVLRTAAESIERSTARSEQYWADAIRLRRGNWELVTAPLPLGAPTGKGADKTSKDFLVSYGLEQSAPLFLRKAIAHIPFFAPSSGGPPLVFPHRDHTRLRITVTKKNANGLASTSHSQVRLYSEDTLDDAIYGAQKEVVDQEVFGELIKEAGELPTASSRISERLIVIEAAQNIELRFELIDEDLIASSNSSAGSSSDTSGAALCDLIAHSLPVLLLRQHSHAKAIRLGLNTASHSASPRSTAPRILQPIIDLLQYYVFLVRVRGELENTIGKLHSVDVKANMRFEGVGETGKEIVNMLSEGKGRVSGEALLRIDDRHSIQFTFVSPSLLVVHLSQATIPIVSIPQLSQLLVDEIERTLLGRICEIGNEVCQSVNGAWFVDEMMCRAVGRWERCTLEFRIRCGDGLQLDCHAHQTFRPRSTGSGGGSLSATFPMAMQLPISWKQTQVTYSAREKKDLGLFAWVRHIIEATLVTS